jgi:hypothetical protein
MCMFLSFLIKQLKQANMQNKQTYFFGYWGVFLGICSRSWEKKSVIIHSLFDSCLSQQDELWMRLDNTTHKRKLTIV